MEWYYAESNQRRGPVTEAELDDLVARGQVDARGPVWREGWED